MRILLNRIFSLLLPALLLASGNSHLYAQSSEKPDSVAISFETVEISEEILLNSTDSLEFLDYSKFYYPRTPKNPYKFKVTELIVPVTLLGVGIWGLENNWWRKVNTDIKNEVQRHRTSKFPIDDFTQFVPAVAGYGMNLLGYKGIHDVIDATIIYATTYILLGITLYPMKHFIHSWRPSLRDNDSFPSGHTAIAFAGAELLRREYWHVSPWIGIGGYLVAGVTGFLRVYNDAHWLNDVIAGAGLGILCAEAAYWLYPVITKAFFKKRAKANVFIAPALSTNQIGMACAINF